MSIINVPAETIRKMFHSVLDNIGVRKDVAEHLIEGIIQASLRGVDSHGIRLFPHYLKGFEGGRLNKNPKYSFSQTAASTGKLDADHAPGHAAGMDAMLKAIKLAKESGIGAVTVYNSSHFGAAAYYALEAAKQDMIGLSFTNATAHVIPYGGKRPFLGNNPVCFVAPCEGEGPFCLDMATTPTTFNKLNMFKERGEPIPAGWAADEDGRETQDPDKAKHLFPIGLYKGFGLSMMVEILCGLLTGAPLGPKISHMFGTPMSEKRLLGHFFAAIRIDCFEDLKTFKTRLKKMMDELRNEPIFDPRNPIMVPGDPEKKNYQIRSKNGIPVPSEMMDSFKQIVAKYSA